MQKLHTPKFIIVALYAGDIRTLLQVWELWVVPARRQFGEDHPLTEVELSVNYGLIMAGEQYLNPEHEKTRVGEARWAKGVPFAHS